MFRSNKQKIIFEIHNQVFNIFPASSKSNDQRRRTADKYSNDRRPTDETDKNDKTEKSQ